MTATMEHNALLPIVPTICDQGNSSRKAMGAELSRLVASFEAPNLGQAQEISRETDSLGRRRPMMKAMTYRQYGGPDVVTLSEVAKPSPKPKEVLIRILATTVTTGDWRARSLNMPAGFGLLGRVVFGLTGPRQPILGTELAGIVETVGAEVTRFRPGDEVIAFTGGRFGGHAEYRTMPEDGTIATKPANLSFEEAASLSFGSMNALPFLRDKARIKRGERVLVVGASGAVGTAAVQIARHFGADVTGVTSTSNVNLVPELIIG